MRIKVSKAESEIIGIKKALRTMEGYIVEWMDNYILENQTNYDGRVTSIKNEIDKSTGI